MILCMCEKVAGDTLHVGFTSHLCTLQVLPFCFQSLLSAQGVCLLSHAFASSCCECSCSRAIKVYSIHKFLR